MRIACFHQNYEGLDQEVPLQLVLALPLSLTFQKIGHKVRQWVCKQEYFKLWDLNVVLVHMFEYFCVLVLGQTHMVLEDFRMMVLRIDVVWLDIIYTRCWALEVCATI